VVNNIVAAILLISITVAGASTLYHYRESIEIGNSQPLVLERIGAYNTTYDIDYIASGCLNNIIAYNITISNFTRVDKACAGSLVLLPHVSPNK